MAELTELQKTYLKKNPFPWEWGTGGDDPNSPIWVDHGCVQSGCPCSACKGHRVTHRAAPGWNVTVEFATPDMKMESCHMCAGTGINDKVDIYYRPLVDKNGKVIFGPALFRIRADDRTKKAKGKY